MPRVRPGRPASRRCKTKWALVTYKRNLGGVVTKWSAHRVVAGGTGKLVVAEYASLDDIAPPTTWYSSIGGAPLGQWFHWRVWLFAWNGATSPSVTQMAMSYTTGTAVPPDGWTITRQHALDAGTRVYGTQSLRVNCNGTALRRTRRSTSSRTPTTSCRVASSPTATPGAQIIISQFGTSGRTWCRLPSRRRPGSSCPVKTPVWNSGANSYVYVRGVGDRGDRCHGVVRRPQDGGQPSRHPVDPGLHRACDGARCGRYADRRQGGRRHAPAGQRWAVRGHCGVGQRTASSSTRTWSCTPRPSARSS